MLAHGGEGEHAAIVGIDAPALSGDVAAPDETDVAPVGGRGAEAADHRLARNIGMREVAEFDAIEYVLPGGKIFQQHLRGEVALGQRGDRRQSPRIAERFGSGDLDHHLRWPVRARPHHAAVGADIAGLHAMGDLRPVGGAAEIGHRNGTERAGAGHCAVDRKRRRESPGRLLREILYRHANLPGRPTGCAESPTDLGRLCDGAITEQQFTTCRRRGTARRPVAGFAACSSAAPCGRPPHCGTARARC